MWFRRVADKGSDLVIEVGTRRGEVDNLAISFKVPTLAVGLSEMVFESRQSPYSQASRNEGLQIKTADASSLMCLYAR